MKKPLSKLALAITLCLTVSMTAQTPGTLTCVFTPTTPAGSTFNDGSKHIISAWIETSIGTFIKTKLHYCCSGNTSDHTPTWKSKSGGSVVDALTGSTKSSYAALTFTWNGTNVSNTLVDDGTYHIVVEDCWQHGTAGITTYTFSFTKGAASSTVIPIPTDFYIDAKVIWQVASLASMSEVSSINPIIYVYPNPTEGIFNVEFKNANSIKVINALGVIVYDEKIEQLTEGVKHIDLSHFSNGVYFITISNGINSSNLKVLLNK